MFDFMFVIRLLVSTVYVFFFREGDVEECTALVSQSVQRFLPEAARDQPLWHASYLQS